ncbi:type II secretion system minor pseudopilin GspJ [Maricaulis sp.]|uniref:type II secretion system minor pseudopilin GspJ n=1 Tax=Maricaulis sp. TaxID=1486257 RepID=UPI00262481C0|nr:type II secretion system minor pseudopilin GspJ [Maricaulis sp.]
MMTHPADQSAGFSLLEVLIATFVFAVIGTISVALLASTLTARDVNEKALARSAGLDRVRVLLREDLGQLADRTVRGADGYPRSYVFAGDNAGLRLGDDAEAERILFAFTRHGRANPGYIRARSSLIHVEYLVRGGQLIRRASDYPDMTGETRQSEQVLADRAEAIAADFYFGVNWRSQALRRPGSENEAFPRAVRLRFTAPDFGALEFIAVTPEGLS